MVRLFPGNASSNPGYTSSNIVTLASRAGSRSADNRRCFAGLSFEETMEFEALDAFPPLDDNGNVVWPFEGEPTTHREKRWLELYRKHDRALKPARLRSSLCRLHEPDDLEARYSQVM